MFSVECGLIMGIAILCLLAYATDQIIIMLIAAAIKQRHFKLEDLCYSVFGSVGRNIILFFMFVCSFGTMIACIVVVGDTVPISLQHVFNSHSMFLDRIFISIVMSIIFILPLALIRNISDLSVTSLFGGAIALLFIVIILIAGHSESERLDIDFDAQTDITIVSPTILRGIGILAFHFVCQHYCLLLYNNMERPTLKEWIKVSHYSIGIVLFISLSIALSGTTNIKLFTYTNVHMCMYIIAFIYIPFI